MAQIALEHISKQYKDGFEAVKDLNLDVADGEFMILVGPSGCGKSTALRMVAGLEDITSGELKIGGTVVNDKAPKDRDIAMVFQNYALYPHMTVRDNMGFALKLAKTPQAEIDKKVNDAAKILDLEQHLERKPANLSGGQRQRVAMGRAIVRNPSAFLMDEPLSNLDAKLRVQMRTEISRIQSRFETTTIYVTHDQTEALTLGDRIAVMRAGLLQQVGEPGDLYRHPDNLFVAGFIGSPSMNFLPGEIDGDTLKLPIGDVPLTDSMRRRLEAGPGGGRGGVIVGMRPEDFEDVELVSAEERGHGVTFTAKIDVLESMGSEFYAYFVLEADKVSSHELDELAKDAGAADLPTQEGNQVVARLDAASRVRQGAETELWFNTEHLHLFDPDGGKSLLGRIDGEGSASRGQSAAGPAPSAGQRSAAAGETSAGTGETSAGTGETSAGTGETSAGSGQSAAPDAS
ncbi:MAG TPA: sn-glycerol-3-phosphate ABC transporter ATP-binding protein UgpC [Solirubrobacteraceae bacterium]|nr:sn-glycerol-3-phosphate ABC transporter ATP-binding protein UgpC [Solirubrobacteraceae bacterium]